MDAARDAPRGAAGFVVGQGASKQVRQGQGGIRLKYRPPHASHHRASSLVLYGVGRALKTPFRAALSNSTAAPVACALSTNLLGLVRAS